MMLLLLLSIGVVVQAQNITLSGYLRDASNGEALIGATVYVEELKQGTASNAYGFYSITIPEGSYTLQVSFIGYKTVKQKIDARESLNISLSLQENTEVMEEIIVSGEAANANVERIEMGMEKLPVKTIQKLQAFMG